MHHIGTFLRIFISVALLLGAPAAPAVADAAGDAMPVASVPARSSDQHVTLSRIPLSQVSIAHTNRGSTVGRWEVVASQPSTSSISLDEIPVITLTNVLTAVVVPIEAITAPTATPTPVPTAPPPTPEPTPDPSSPVLDTEFSDVLEGTIVANRSEASVSFFVEGELYRLAPLRSFGIDLPRDTAVLNLYSCDADTPQSTAGCFWDPFLLEPDGFYEIFNSSPSGNTVNLTLREAGTPPENQVWVQNRTGQRETLYYQGETIELPPATVKEFGSSGSPIITIHARSCLSLAGETVCEWRPLNADAGFYYALEEVNSVGLLADSVVNAIELRPLVSSNGESFSGPVTLLCQLQIAVANVRSGPGLDYLIVGQTTGTETEAGGIVAVGREPTNQWIAVDQSIAPGGWIFGGADFLTCDGNIAALPIAEVTDGRLAPEPVVQNPAPVEASVVITEEAATEAEGETGGVKPIEIPEGQALLVVNSVFEHDLRFTLNPDEYDMKQGDVVQILVNPGRIQFSASTPWNGGLSGNAEFIIEAGQTFNMFLYFIPDPNNRGEWDMQYQ